MCRLKQLSLLGPNKRMHVQQNRLKSALSLVGRWSKCLILVQVVYRSILKSWKRFVKWPIIPYPWITLRTSHNVFLLFILYMQSFPRPSCQWSSPTLLSLCPLPCPLHPLTGTLGYNNGVTQVCVCTIVVVTIIVRLCLCDLLINKLKI